MTARNLVTILFVILLLGSLLLAACESSPPASTPDASTVPPAASDPAPEVSAALLLQERCGGCHNLQRVESARKTPAEWESTVRRMVNLGASLNDAEFAALVEYLAANYKK